MPDEGTIGGDEQHSFQAKHASVSEEILLR